MNSRQEKSKMNDIVITIDVGNTNIVIGGYKDDELIFTGRILTNVEDTADIMKENIDTILKGNHISKEEIEGSIISSVVPKITPIIEEYLRELTHKEPFVMGKNTDYYITILRENIHKVGADLIASAVAAKEKYLLPAIVFDLGTATTATVVNKNGEYIGGVIYPGIKIGLKALFQNAALLPDIELEAPEKCINGETIKCMQSGAIYGTASMIDGLIDKMEAELGQKATIILTGGLSEIIKEYVNHEFKYVPDLLLEGLYILYQKNTNKEKVEK